MMRLINNKKNVKIVSFLVALIFVLGVGALAYTQMATPSMAADTSNIGVVDTSRLLNGNSPIVAEATKQMDAYKQELNTQFQKESANMDDQQKAKLASEYQGKMQNKMMELQKGIQAKVSDAAKSVGDAKGLTVVMDKNSVLYGGVDITEQVQKKLESSSGNASDTTDKSDAK